jgi:hypothetical protein
MKNGWNRAPAALPDHHNYLGLAVLIALQATVAAILFLIGGLHIPSKISAVDFSRLPFAADDATAHCFCHGFTQLVQQHEFL